MRIKIKIIPDEYVKLIYYWDKRWYIFEYVYHSHSLSSWLSDAEGIYWLDIRVSPKGEFMFKKSNLYYKKDDFELCEYGFHKMFWGKGIIGRKVTFRLSNGN